MKLSSIRISGRKLTLIIILCTAAISYGLVSLVNHYYFRTFSLDLGLYTNAMYDYAHFRWNDSLAFRGAPENLLSDHFDLYLPLFSPLTWIFGTWTLLIVQIGVIIFGAAGVYRLLASWYEQKIWLAFAALVAFLGFFGIWSALAFDYHSNVVAAMLVPWLFYYADRKQPGRMWLFFVLILVAKENMSLWMVFIGLGLSWKYHAEKKLRNLLLLMSGLSLCYFVLVTGFVMPTLSHEQKLHNFPYGALGGNTREAAAFIFAHPAKCFELLFVNPTPDHNLDFVKAELWIFISIFLVFLLRKPYYLLMLVPIIAQKMFSDNFYMWSIRAQYSIEFAPILIIGVFDVFRTFRRSALQVSSLLVVIFSVVTTYRMTFLSEVSEDSNRLQIIREGHYRRNYDVGRVHLLLSSIPANSSVSTQTAFVPHVALRDTVYTFPQVGDASYLFLHRQENHWPLSDDEMNVRADDLLKSPLWQPVFIDKDIIFMKRIKK